MHTQQVSPPFPYRHFPLRFRTLGKTPLASRLQKITGPPRGHLPTLAASVVKQGRTTILPFLLYHRIRYMLEHPQSMATCASRR